jgi:Protein of unknown function (DUF2973)
MLHLLYILAFTIIAFLAVGNLIRSLVSISYDYQYSANSRPRRPVQVPHPEFLDETGNVIEEPLLVMKSIAVEDARQQLESLYKNPPESPST